MHIEIRTWCCENQITIILITFPVCIQFFRCCFPFQVECSVVDFPQARTKTEIVIEDFSNATQIMLESHEYCLRMKYFCCCCSFFFHWYSQWMRLNVNSFFFHTLQYQWLKYKKFKSIAFASILTRMFCYYFGIFFVCFCCCCILFSMRCLSLLF